MMLDKELLTPKELTAQEVSDMVKEWVDAGGVIKQCKPSVALNYRFESTDQSESLKLKREPTRRIGKPKKKK